jgi:hypothetical protein
VSDKLTRNELLLSPGPDDGDWTDVVKRAKRAHRRQVYAAAVLLALVVVGVAFTYAIGGVPWSNRKPHLAPAHPPLALPCTANDIRGVATFQPANFTLLLGDIHLTNVGRHACSLIGWPRVSVLDPGGSKEPVRISHMPQQGYFDSQLLDPRGSLRALEPGKRVSVQLWWMPKHSCSVTLGLTLAGGSRVDIPILSFGGGPVSQETRLLCPGSQYSYLRVSPFIPASPAKGASMQLPLSVRIVGRRNTVVGHGIPAFLARRGSVFHFEVALKNTSRHPFRFRSCPLYEESDAGVADYAYVLNCHGVGLLAPNASALFQMQMRIPRDAELGSGLLGWYLAPYSSRVVRFGKERSRISDSPTAMVELRIVR